MLCFCLLITDGEMGMEDESRSVSGFLHFDTVSKGGLKPQSSSTHSLQFEVPK